jgi:hypothetical protein
MCHATSFAGRQAKSGAPVGVGLRGRPLPAGGGDPVESISVCERVWFAGEGSQGLRDLVDGGADVGGGGCVVLAAGVAGVRPRDGVAKVSFDPGERGVT